MKIKTTIPVTYNSGIASQEQGLVTGTLRMCMQDLTMGGCNFNYKYVSDTGVDLDGNNLSLSNDEINGLYTQVKDLVPADLSYSDSTQYLYLLGMKIKMAETFGISPNDIEILMD